MKHLRLFLLIFICFIHSSLFAEDKNLYIFTSKTCGPCDSLKTFIFNDPDIAKEFEISFIDIDDYPDLAKTYKVKLVPTSIIFVDNKDIGRLIGYGNDYKQKFRKIIKRND